MPSFSWTKRRIRAPLGLRNLRLGTSRVFTLDNCRNIAIALTNPDFGEQKAQSCANACFRQLPIHTFLHSVRGNPRRDTSTFSDTLCSTSFMIEPREGCHPSERATSPESAWLRISASAIGLNRLACARDKLEGSPLKPILL